MEITSLVPIIARVCEQMGLRYAVVGSVASGYYGEPRSTRDVDVAVELPSWSVAEFLSHFPEDQFYHSQEAATSAVSHGGQFNLLHKRTGYKIDVMVPGDAPFDELQLDRARDSDLVPGSRVRVAAPEDVILHKLRYFREGGSDKHLSDIASMIKIIGWSDAPLRPEPGIDRGYVEQWALRIGVMHEWRAILTRLGVPPRGDVSP